MKKACIRLAKFFIISCVAWFTLSPSVSHMNVMLGLSTAILSAIILSLSIDVIFYKHILNFFGYFSRIGFYRYLMFMFIEVMKSTFDALKDAFNFSRTYRSKVIHITLPSRTTVDKALLITLSIIITPGTTIIEIQDKTLTVHCLTKSAYQSMEDMSFVKKILSFNF